MKITLTLAVLGFAFSASAQISSSESVIEGKEGFVLGQPICIAQPIVPLFEWSADGEHLIFLRVDQPVSAQSLRDKVRAKATHTIGLWSRRSGKTVELLRSSEGFQLAISWFPKTPVAIVQVIVPFQGEAPRPDYGRNTIYLADARTGRFRQVYKSDDEFGSWVYLSTSSLRDIAVVAAPVGVPLRDDSPRVFSLRFLTPHGPLDVPPLELPLRMPVGEWTTDGNGVAFKTLAREGRSFYDVVDLDTLRQRPGVHEVSVVAPWNPVPTGRVFVLEETIPLRDTEPKLAAKMLRLHAKSESKRKSAIVTTDVQQGKIAPDFQAVAYTSKNLLIVRPIMMVPASLVEDAMAMEHRSELLQRAQQVALAAIMHSADHNDELPGQAEDFVGLFDKYMKNRERFEGFVYTFAGGKLSEVKDPHSTVLGYVEGPGGRAVAYVDGHVKWIKDP